MSAIISDDGRYRYELRRLVADWTEHQNMITSLLWVMLNPSTADEVDDDPTIRKVRGFTRRAGFSEAIVVNLFAHRATKPRALVDATGDKIGPFNDRHIHDCAYSPRTQAIVCAWGTWGSHATVCERRDRVLGGLRSVGKPMLCLGTTQNGDPRHPLMVAYSEPLREFK